MTASAKGEYISGIDAADTAHPMRLEKQVRFLQEHQDICMVGTYAYWVDDDGEIVGPRELKCPLKTLCRGE